MLIIRVYYSNGVFLSRSFFSKSDFLKYYYEVKNRNDVANIEVENKT